MDVAASASPEKVYPGLVPEVADCERLPAKPAIRARRPLPSECFELYHAVETLRVRDRAMVVQFVGPSGGEGTTTVASGFARAAGQAVDPASAASEARLPGVLYVDCGIKRASRRNDADPNLPSLVAALLAGSPLMGAIAPVHDAVGVYRAWLGVADARGTPQCGPAGMARLFDALRRRFSIVVLDCPAASHGLEALWCASHCDGTLLVVRARRTRIGAVEAARDRIERFGGRVIGTVFNRSRRPSRWFGARR